MTDACTRVGIVEWARRARGSRAVGMELADRLGASVASAPDVTTKVAIVRRARAHAWRSEQWDAVVPVLHDVDLAAVGAVDDPELAGALAAVSEATGPAAVLAAASAATARLVQVWRTWAAEAGPVADAPYARVLDVVIRDVTTEPPP